MRARNDVSAGQQCLGASLGSISRKDHESKVGMGSQGVIVNGLGHVRVALTVSPLFLILADHFKACPTE